MADLKIHFERDSARSQSMFLVFMTYLNTVKDGGGTKWINQDVETKGRKRINCIQPQSGHIHMLVWCRLQKQNI